MMDPARMLVSLNHHSLQQNAARLSQIDPDLGTIVSNLGTPPLWSRQPGFPTMIHIILEQQVSLASAKAAFTKLVQAAGELTPARFMAFSDAELRAIGFSRQKTRYGRELSKALLDGALDLNELVGMDDHDARSALMKVKGIGPWTADIYLLMALLRPDIWPVGDLALVKAVREVKGLSDSPDPQTMDQIGERWRPYRAVAARILWHYYLNR